MTCIHDVHYVAYSYIHKTKYNSVGVARFIDASIYRDTFPAIRIAIFFFTIAIFFHFLIFFSFFFCHNDFHLDRKDT